MRYSLAPMSSAGRQLHRLAHSLQIIAGQLDEIPLTDLADVIGETFVDPHSPATRAAELTVQMLRFDTVRRVYRKCGFDDCDLRLSATMTLDELFQHLARLRSLGRQGRGGIAADILKILQSRHDDPGLSAADVATEASVSVRHVIRLLKQATGYGFRRHLRDLRVAHARALILESRMSMKEIAAAVGYARTSDLDRQFKAVTGTSPTAVRRAHRLS